MLDPADWGVWPSSQLNQNNLTVDVHGASFFSTNVSACRVGDFVVPLTHVSSTLVRCTVSPSLRLSKGYAYVEVSMNGLDFTSDRITFTLHEPVKLEQVFPYGWDIGGGGVLRVSGSNFVPGSSKCAFGAGSTGTVPAVSGLAPSEVVSSAFMKCETPAFSTVGMTDTSLRSWGDSGSLSGSRAFEVWREPCSIEIFTTWNSTKAEYGGVAVVLQGSGNEDLVEPNNMFGYSCHFGTITVSAVMDTLTINRTVTCISPASQHPSTSVELWTGPNIDSFKPCTTFPTFAYPADSEDTYTEVVGDETTVVYTGTNISAVPTYVTTSGGSVISLSGISLSTASLCRVGSDASAPVHFVSSSLIQCEIPPHTEGEEYLYSAPSASVEITSVYFTALAEISSVLPSTGGLEGGTAVRVRGANFKDTDDLLCRYGSISVLASYYSTTQVQCVTPAHMIGSIPVGVGRRDGISHSFWGDKLFVYDSTDILGAVMPSVVNNVGSTSLSLVWSVVYSGGTGCKVGGVLLDPCTVSGSTTPGFVQVYSYTFASDERVSEPAAFAYYTSPIVSGSIPVVLQNFIPTVVYMLGSDFVDEANVLCSFGDKAVDATFVSSALVKCASHLVGAVGNTDAQVGFGSASDDGVWSRTVMSLSVVDILTMSSVSPTRGVLAGGTVVTVTGTGFEGGGVVYCRIGTVSYIEARTIHDKKVECTAPSYYDETVDIQVAILGNVYADTAQSFVYSTGVDVVAIIPPTSPLAGGTAISLFGLAGSVGDSYDCVMSGAAVAGTISRFGEVECANPAGEEGFAAVGIGSIIDDEIDQQTIEYARAPVISSVYPLNGPTSGGTLIYTSGSHMRDSAYLSLEANAGASSHFVSSALVVTELPISTAAVFSASVKQNGNLVSNALTFASRAAVTLSSVTPTGIAISGGSVVYVTGSNMPNDNTLYCSFGTILVSAQWSSSTAANCVSPAHLVDSTSTKFRVHADGLSSTTSKDITYVSTSEITETLPPSLSATELPASVTILGAWLASASCDGIALSLNSTWASEFACTLDPVGVGYTAVSVISRGQTMSVSYLIKETPLLLSVSPPGASTMPGELFTLTVQHFIADDADQFHCLFDATSAVAPHIISSSLIRCESVATTKVSTRLTIEGGDGAYPLSRQAAPVVSSIAPSSSGDIGGTLVTLTGTNIPLIDNSAVCSFGSIGPIAAQYATTTTVQCVSPAGVVSSSANICVSVFSTASPSRSCNTIHALQRSDILGAVMPSVVNNVGSTSLSLVWSVVYSGGTGCKVGGVLLDPCTVSGSTTPGFVQVYSYTFASDERVSEPAAFAYYTSPIVSGSIPVVLQNFIPTVVYMLGSDFVDEANVLCSFGDKAVDATFVSSALVKCASHLVGAVGNTDAQVGFGSASDDGVWSRTVMSLSVVDILTMSSVSPTRGVLAGGTVVTVTGTGFEGGGVVYCRIGTVSYIEARTIHDKKVECTAPSYYDETVDIQVAILGNVYADTAQSFVYSTGVDVVAIIPPTSPLAGGTAISLFGLAGSVGDSYDCVMSGAAVAGTISRFGEVECANPAGEEGFAAVGIGSIIDDEIDQQTIEYARAPVISSVYPLNGPTSGGTLIYTSGSHMRDSAYLSLEANAGASSHFVSSALVVTELPISTAAVFSASVKQNGNLVSNALTFASRAAVTLSSVTPTGIAISGGSVVYVTGSNMPNDNTLYCSFGTILVSAQWSSSTAANCVSPAHLVDSTSTKFRVHADGLSSTTSKDITYVSTSEITETLPPSLSATELPASVTILGAWLASASCDGIALSLNSTWASEFACTLDPVGVGYTAVSVISRGQTMSVSYLIKETPLLLSVSPPGASTMPGELFTLTVQHFIADDADQFHCLFDATSAVAPHIISSSLIRCESVATTKVSTRLTIEGGDGAYPLSRQAAPVVSSIAPSSSGDIGGTLVTLTGTNIPLIDNSAVCSFGSIGPIAAQYVSSLVVTCVSPAGVSSASSSVCASVYSALSPSKSCASSPMTYVAPVDPPVILDHGVSSKQGGYFFLWRSSASYLLVPTLSFVEFGRGNATMSSTIVSVYIAPQLPGGFTTVSAIDEVGGVSFDQVMVQPVPTITGLNPRVTPAAGGSQVWISGTDLKSEVLKLSVDDANVDYNIVSSALIVIQTPNHASGGSIIKAQLGSRTDSSGVGIGPFTSTGLDYIDGIDLTSISSSLGPTTGTMSVSLVGEGFSDTSELGCRFGTLGPVTASYVHGREIRCAVPNHIAGQVPVEVSANRRDFTFNSTIPSNGAVWGTSTYYYWSASPGGTPTTYRGVTYTYAKSPYNVDAVIPAHGPMHITTEYTIFGAGLDSAVTDLCSSLNVTARQVSSTDGSITCSWGASAVAGFVQVGVYAIVSTYTQYDSTQTQFEYYDPLSVTSVDPLVGPVDGGTVLFMSGANFRKGDVSRVMFGSTAVVSHVVSSALGIIETPTFATKGTKALYASTHEHSPSTAFTALDQLLLSSVSPTFSPIEGGSTLIVSGDKLSAPSTIWCRAGTIGPFYARAYDSKVLKCISPAHSKESVHLQISMNKRDWRYELTLSLANPALPSGTSVDSILTLDYVFPAKIKDVLPRAGHVTDQVATVEAFYEAPYPAQNVSSRGCLTGGTTLTSTYSVTTNIYSILCTLERDSFIEGMYPIIITGPDAANTSFSGSFHYVTSPTIDAWGPEVIHTGGGTLVSVMLVDAISDGLVCMFSPWYQNEFTATFAIDAHFVSSSLIICESPYADPLIEIGLTAGLLGTTPEDGQAELNSIMRPAITSLQADSLFLDGGSAMNIFGTDLGMQVYDLYASLGTISPLALRWVTAAQVEAISPATVSGNKMLFLSHALSARSDPYEAELTFFKPFEPSPLIPSVVPAKDNVFVRLHAHIGSLPSSVPTCNPAAPQYTLCQEANNIGGILTQIHSVNFAILQLPGGANLTVNVPQLAYVDGASSATVQPNIAVTGGGTVAVVSGVNFVEGMTSIRLGDVAQTNPYISQSFLSSALIRFEAPAGASDATASIYTSTGFVDSDSWGSAGAVMKYRSLPSMTNAAALETLESGGRLVKLTGSGFVSNRDLFCKFGEIHVRATYVSATILNCVAPGLKPQTYSVRVSNNMLDYSKFVNSASSDSDTDATVTPVPDFTGGINSATNLFGPNSGGTLISFSFSASVPSSLACKFFSRYGNGFISDSSTAKCLTPSSDAGFVPVQLSPSSEAGTSYTAIGIQFEFQEAPEIDMVYPEMGVFGGGTVINVHGDNLIQSVSVASHGSPMMPGTSVDGLSCRFGGMYTVGAVHVSSTIMRCETPTFSIGLMDAPLVVDLSLNADDWTGSQIVFEPIENMPLSSLSPLAGTRAGGTTLTVASSYFPPDTPVWCKFGTTGPIHALFNGDGSVRCKSPAKAEGDIPIAISRGNPIDFAFDYTKIFKM